MDLVGRKLRRDGGEGMAELIADLKSINDLAKASSRDMSVCTAALSQGIETLETATQIVLKADDKDAFAIATPYQTLCSHIISGALLIKACARGAAANDPLTENMLQLARYLALSIMPLADAQLDFMRVGANALFDYPMLQLADL